MDSDGGWRSSLLGLHKGRGVRGSLERVLLKSTLGSAWHIDKSDSVLMQRAKVIYRLDAVFNHLTDAEQRLALPFLYNTPADPHMANLDYQERMDLLQRRYPDKAYSSRTLHRMRTNITDRIAASLERDALPFDKEILGKVVKREQLFSAELMNSIHPQLFSALVQKGYDAPMGESIAAFLKLHVFVPRARDNELIVGRTSRHGLWVCVFSVEHQLSAHPVAKRQEQDGGCHDVVVGAALVREVISKWRTVGIVVNPPAVRSSESGVSNSTALRVPAEILPALLDAG